MTRRFKRGVLLVLGALLVAAVAYTPLSRRVRSAQLLEHLAGGATATQAPYDLIERVVAIPGRSGPIRVRIYQPARSASAPGLVIAHGVHYQGIDEKRLVAFARELARAGRIVVTPELTDLMDYRITGASVDVIERSVRWLTEQPQVSRPKVGLLGVSFGGGLSLVAAEKPEVAQELEYVTSVGGHYDLEEVLHFLVTDEIATPSGVLRLKAHDYGLVVAVYGYLDRFVDPQDQSVMRGALRAWLHEDRPTARSEAAKCTTDGCRHLFDLVQNGRARELAPELERLLVEHRAELAELSPRGKLAAIGVPVYLLHGSADTVIPPSETEWAGLELERSPHLALVSPLVQHVEMKDDASLGDKFRLVEFVARML